MCSGRRGKVTEKSRSSQRRSNVFRYICCGWRPKHQPIEVSATSPCEDEDDTEVGKERCQEKRDSTTCLEKIDGHVGRDDGKATNTLNNEEHDTARNSKNKLRRRFKNWFRISTKSRHSETDEASTSRENLSSPSTTHEERWSQGEKHLLEGPASRNTSSKKDGTELTVISKDGIQSTKSVKEEGKQSQNAETSWILEIVEQPEEKGFPGEKIMEASHDSKELTSQPDVKNISYSFLRDHFTVDYINNSKVMFIMKGLPGSGKSTLTSAISKMFKDATVCSADLFFSQDGSYSFDHTKLGEAHIYSKEMAIKAAVAQTKVIAIDNTNVQQWEMKFYVKLARQFNYVTIVVEPQTPWRFDAEILAEKNSHSVTRDILEKKVRQYEDVRPLYCAWFLNEADSYLLNKKAREWLGKAFRLHNFKEAFSESTGVNSLSEAVDYYCNSRSSLQPRMLHCTTKFLDRRAGTYLRASSVKKSLGKAFTLTVSSFIISTTTLGARVRLNSEQVEVFEGCGDTSLDGQVEEHADWGNGKKRWWGPPENVDIPDNAMPLTDSITKATLHVRRATKSRKKKRSAINWFKKNSSVEDAKENAPTTAVKHVRDDAKACEVPFKESNYENKSVVKYSEKNRPPKDGENVSIKKLVDEETHEIPSGDCGAARAHITLGTAAGVAPVNTGIVQETIVRMEREGKEPEVYMMEGARLKFYGDNMWELEPDCLIDVTALFAYQL